jgi:hypothetical protein
LAPYSVEDDVDALLDGVEELRRNGLQSLTLHRGVTS